MINQNLTGQALPRVEDFHLLRGEGQYMSDVSLPGQWVMALLRSPHAHAHIRSIRRDKAQTLPGVHAVVTAGDLSDLRRPLPGMTPIAPPPLADATVYYVGQPIVAVLADNRYSAEDAIDLIEIDYEPLAPLTTVEEALGPNAPLLHPSFGKNIFDEVSAVHGQGAQGLQSAEVIVSATLKLGRVSAQPMEPRGIWAQYDADHNHLTVYHATQSVHRARERIAEYLTLPTRNVRVIAPEIGGGFGVKNGSYPEEVLVPYFAKHFGQAIKWQGDRFEEFLSTYQEREQIHQVQIGVTRDGSLVGLTDTFYQDQGAFPAGGAIVLHTTLNNLTGPYRVPHVAIYGATVCTNKVPQAPYRGAGRPQGHYVIERMLDRAADQLGMDRIAIREKNLITPPDLPYEALPHVVLDSGDYPSIFKALVDEMHVEDFRVQQAQRRAQGTRLGLGVANYVEVSGGFGFEGARMTLQADGRIQVATGATGQGQGHRTALAQIAADMLQVPMAAIDVIEGDSDQIERGIGTFGSRTMIMAGNATDHAGRGLIAEAKGVAAELLEAHADDIIFDQGRFFVSGVPSRSLSWRSLAEQWEKRAMPPISHEEYFQSSRPSFGFGTHAAIVSVDEDTGQIVIHRYVVFHDAGTLVNPLLADGQVMGGVVQGLGSAITEEMRYSSDGQPLTTSFMDYRLPGTKESPPMEIHHVNFPAPGNDKGYKGVGEAGIIPVQALLLSAVEDAFSDRHLQLSETPITPHRLYQALHEKEACQ